MAKREWKQIEKGAIAPRLMKVEGISLAEKNILYNTAGPYVGKGGEI